MIGVSPGVRVILGLSDLECACTLGSVALSDVALVAVVGTFDGVSILGDGVSGSGSVFALLIISVVFCRALRAGSPASKLNVAVEGGTIRMVIMS